MFEDCVAKVSFRNENTFQEETELSLGKQQAKEEREIRSSLKLIGSRTVMSAICYDALFSTCIRCAYLVRVRKWGPIKTVWRNELEQGYKSKKCRKLYEICESKF